MYDNPTGLIDPSGKRGKNPKEKKPQVSDNAAFYICCQKGDFGICEGPLASQKPPGNNALLDMWHARCQKEHEEQHISDLHNGMVPGMAGYCKGKPNGTMVLIPTEYKPQVECSGYTRQKQFLEGGPAAFLSSDLSHVQKECQKNCGSSDGSKDKK